MRTVDMSYAISCSNGGSVRIWDAITGKRLFNLKGQQGKVSSLCVVERRAVGEVLLLSGGEDKMVHVWSVESGKHLKLLEGHENEVTCMKSQRFVSVAALQGVTKADKEKERKEREAKRKEREREDAEAEEAAAARRGGVQGGALGVGVSMSREARDMTLLLLSGSRDKTIRVWDYREGVSLFVLSGHSSFVVALGVGVSLQFSHKCLPRTPLIISGRCIQYAPLQPPHFTTSSCCQTTPHHTIHVYHIYHITPHLVMTLPCFLSHYQSDLMLMLTPMLMYVDVYKSICVFFGSGGDDGTLILWNLWTGKPVKEIKGHVNSIKGLSTCLLTLPASSSSPSSPPHSLSTAEVDAGERGGRGREREREKEMVVATCGWDKLLRVIDVDDSLSTDAPTCQCSIC